MLYKYYNKPIKSVHSHITGTVKLVESECCAFQHVVQPGKIIQSLDVFLLFYV